MEEFIEGAGPASAAAVADLCARLRSDGPVASQLADGLEPLARTLEQGPLSGRRQMDVDALVLPRLWRLVEGWRDGLPDGEMLNRVHGLSDRLAELVRRPDDGW